MSDYIERQGYMFIIVVNENRVESRTGGELESFPEMLRAGRQDAGMTFRGLSERLEEQGSPASITQLNLVEKQKVKPTYRLAYDTAKATGLRVEDALRSAYLYRVQWSIEREKEQLLRLLGETELSAGAFERITAL